MRRSGALLLLALAGCATGGGATSRFLARFNDPAIEQDFSCEVQKLYVDSVAKVKEVPLIQSAVGKTLEREPGSETLAWLYHFEDDGDPLKDEERAFTIVVSLRKRKAGRYPLPSEEASVIFFCDNWGRGFRAAEARATSGWLDIHQADETALSGEFAVTLDGYRERGDKAKEALGLHLQGHFRAVR